MKQTASIISTYTADVSGVPSSLFELGGMVVIHDASGCNSTYNTHDEPRWYDFDSMVYISGLSEMEAIMGDDEKLIGDIVSAASELRPKFIALCGTPIPMMIGTDFEAICSIIEKRTGIPCLPVKTNGMNTYVKGASEAFYKLARRFVKDSEKTDSLSVNILGVTPLDFSVNGGHESIKNALSERGIEVLSCWAMGDDLEKISASAAARVNLVASLCGLKTAEYMKEKFGTPYVVARPCGKKLTDRICEDIRLSAEDNNCRVTASEIDRASDSIVIIGEGVYAKSISNALYLEKGIKSLAVCATEDCGVKYDKVARDEEELVPALKNAKYIIADPLYRPICPKDAAFIPLPHEAFSGRIFRSDIPDLTNSIEIISQQIRKV